MIKNLLHTLTLLLIWRTQARSSIGRMLEVDLDLKIKTLHLLACQSPWHAIDIADMTDFVPLHVCVDIITFTKLNLSTNHLCPVRFCVHFTFLVHWCILLSMMYIGTINQAILPPTGLLCNPTGKMIHMPLVQSTQNTTRNWNPCVIFVLYTNGISFYQ